MQVDVDLFKRLGKSWNGPDHFVTVYVMVSLVTVTATAIFKLQLWSGPLGLRYAALPCNVS